MYPTNKPYSSKEIAQVVDRWQFCRFFDLETREEIISISYTEIYKPGTHLRCNPSALDKIKIALTQAYDRGIRKVGMLAPHLVRIELTQTALSVTSNPEWIVETHEEPTYFKNLVETENKVQALAEYAADLEVDITAIEKNICDELGFTDEILDEVLDHIDEDTPFEKLPKHLQILFHEGHEPEKKSE